MAWCSYPWEIMNNLTCDLMKKKNKPPNNSRSKINITVEAGCIVVNKCKSYQQMQFRSFVITY